MPSAAPTMISAISPVSRFLPTMAFGRAFPIRYVRRGWVNGWVVTGAHLLGKSPCSNPTPGRSRTGTGSR